ncbi:MAG: hypothetical protein AB7O04_13375 [Hyphomonadaceae bacterium]
MTSTDVQAPADLSAGKVLLITGALFAIYVGGAALFPNAIVNQENGELGFLENAQAAALAAAFVASLFLLPRARAAGGNGLLIWCALISLGLFYTLGEEISWGQHYFGWATTGWFERYNDQGETNLHNTSSWFDQKPRALLLLGMIVGGIIHPLVKLARKGRGLFDKPWWLAPTLAATPPAVLAELAALPERLDDALGTSLQFYRSSEVEEFFLYAFLFVYVLSLLRRTRPGKA